MLPVKWEVLCCSTMVIVVQTPGRNAMPTTPDKRMAHAIGVRLRNLLKLPKAHKWVCYEFFYSNLDS